MRSSLRFPVRSINFSTRSSLPAGGGPRSVSQPNTIIKRMTAGRVQDCSHRQKQPLPVQQVGATYDTASIRDQ